MSIASDIFLGGQELNIPIKCSNCHIGLVRLQKPVVSKKCGLGEW